MPQRTCDACGRPLSRYNPGDRCGGCVEAARDEVALPNIGLPPSYWFRTDIRKALGLWDWRTVLNAVAHDADLSQTRLAEITGISQSQVSKLMSGVHKQAAINTMFGIVDGLGIPRLLVGLAPKKLEHLTQDKPGTARATVSRVKRRDFGKAALGITLALPGLGAAPGEPVDITRLEPEQVTADLYALDFQYGGATVVDIARQRLAHLTRQLNRMSVPSDAENRLQRMVGELAACAGWAAYDAGHAAMARSLFRDALYAFTITGDRVQRSRILGLMSVQALKDVNPLESLNTAEAAVEAAKGTTPQLQALMWMRVAGACSLANYAGRYRTALRNAQQLTERTRSDGAPPTWFSFFDEAEMIGLDATSQLRLGQHSGAKTRFRQSADRCTEVLSHRGLYPRNRAYYTAVQTEAYMAMGDVDAVAATVHDALPILADVTSGRTLDRLANVGQALDGERSPAAVECKEIIAGLTE